MNKNLLLISTMILLSKCQFVFCQSSFTPVSTTNSAISPNPNQPVTQKNNWLNNSLPLQRPISNSNWQQQFQMANENMRQAELRRTELAEANGELEREKQKRLYEERLRLTAPYRKVFDKLVNDSVFSITQAVYTVENAFLDERLPYQAYSKLIAEKVRLCKEIMKREKLNTNDNLAKNYAIQQLYSRKIQIADNRAHLTKTYNPLQYDFNDFMGDKDWTKMFVTKLMLTGKGQCHSMPLLYLMLAEQLKAKAYLSIAPEHSYIQFPSGTGNLYNFETTQGKLVTDNAIMMSGFINSTAIKNKLYMDTMNNKQLLALCLMDLEQGYISKFGYDAFVVSVNEKVLEIDPNNISGLLTKATIKSYQFESAANSVGRPPIDKLPLYPEVYKLYQERQELYSKVDNSGYQTMPQEAYELWLQSLKDIQQQKESKLLQEQIRNKLKLPKSTLINKTN